MHESIKEIYLWLSTVMLDDAWFHKDMVTGIWKVFLTNLLNDKADIASSRASDGSWAPVIHIYSQSPLQTEVHIADEE